MKDKEKLFCSYYASRMNRREAAYKAGYKINPEKAAMKLLERDEVRQQIKLLLHHSSEGVSESVASGLKRLAFGSITDALRLIFADKEQIDDEFVESLDLFSVSEIKFQKNGAIEIKFFDRLKALSALADVSEAGEIDSAMPFYKALEKSAEKIKGANMYDE